MSQPNDATDQAREFIVQWHLVNMKDHPHFTKYIRETLAGDFAFQLAKALAPAQQAECGGCHGTGRMVRDPDIGTDQECFACDGTGKDAFNDSTAEQDTCAFCGRVGEDVCDTPPVDICEKALGALQLVPGTSIAAHTHETKESTTRAADDVSGSADLGQSNYDGNSEVKGTMSGNNWYLTARERVMIRAMQIAAERHGPIEMGMYLKFMSNTDDYEEAAAVALVLAGAVK